MRKFTIHQSAAVVIVKLFVIIVAFLAIPGPADSAESLNNAGVESFLKSYEEQGYTFKEKIDEATWLVEYMRPDWDLAWEVIVTSTSPDPEKSLVVIGTTLLTLDSLNGNLLAALLQENSLDSNPGNYSLYADQGQYFIQYTVKAPQTMLSEKVLSEGIGFVAGYANRRIHEIEKYIKPKTQAAPEQESTEKSGAGESPESDSSEASEPEGE